TVQVTIVNHTSHQSTVLLHRSLHGKSDTLYPETQPLLEIGACDNRHTGLHVHRLLLCLLIYARRQLQALVRRRHNALVDCAPRLPLEYARHFLSVLSSCTVLDLVLSTGRTSGFIESNALSTRSRRPRQSTSSISTRYRATK